MLVRLCDARVHERTGLENRSCLFRGRLKGELGQDGGRRVVGEENVVDVGGGFVDGADDELACARGVLQTGEER